jgi:hypothetical protein
MLTTHIQCECGSKLIYLNLLMILYIKATVWCLFVTGLSGLHNPFTDSMVELGGQCKV